MKEYIIEMFSLEAGQIAVHTCMAASKKLAKADARRTYPDYCIISVVELADAQLQPYHLQEEYV